MGVSFILVFLSMLVGTGGCGIGLERHAGRYKTNTR